MWWNIGFIILVLVLIAVFYFAFRADRKIAERAKKIVDDAYRFHNEFTKKLSPESLEYLNRLNKENHHWIYVVTELEARIKALEEKQK